MSAGPSSVADNNHKYDSLYQTRKEVMKRKEIKVLKQGGLLKFLKPADTEKGKPLNDESKHSEILSEDTISINQLQGVFWLITLVNS